MSSLSCERLSPSLGAEVRGIDLRRALPAAEIEEIRAALLEHQVLFFRDQELDLEAFSRFAKGFGRLTKHPRSPSPEGFPGLVRLHADESSKKVVGETWHSDGCCDEEPPMASILHLHTVPVGAGDTLFASMTAAYEALPDVQRQRLEGLEAVHGSLNARWYAEGRFRGRRPNGTHPLVRTHPETGRRSLFLNRTFTERVVEMEVGESRELLDELFDHVEQPAFQMRFAWQPHSVAFWDNRCTIHRAIFDYHPRVRSGVRAMIAGERPV